MHKKRNGTIWPRITAVAVAILVVLGMWLSVASASGDDGVIETPAITATATATTEVTDNPVIEAPEVEDEGEKPETNAPAPTATATATTEVTDNPVIEAPEVGDTEDPAEEPVPPMEQFVDVVVGECKVTITQKDGVEWTEVIADNGDPSHWGVTKGNPTLVVKPVDLSKDLVVRIIPVISENESWEYSVTLEASASCDESGPAPTPTPTDPPSGEPTGEPTDPPTTDEPTGEPTPTSTPTEPPTTDEPTGEPTDPPSGEPTGEPTPADPSTTGEPTDPSTPTPTSTPTKAPTKAPSADKSDPKGPPKTGVIGDDSTDAILAGTALAAAIMTSALVAMRMKRRPSGKYAARS